MYSASILQQRLLAKPLSAVPPSTTSVWQAALHMAPGNAALYTDCYMGPLAPNKKPPAFKGSPLMTVRLICKRAQQISLLHCANNPGSAQHNSKQAAIQSNAVAFGALARPEEAGSPHVPLPTIMEVTLPQGVHGALAEVVEDGPAYVKVVVQPDQSQAGPTDDRGGSSNLPNSNGSSISDSGSNGSNGGHGSNGGDGSSGSNTNSSELELLFTFETKLSIVEHPGQTVHATLPSHGHGNMLVDIPMIGHADAHPSTSTHGNDQSISPVALISCDATTSSEVAVPWEKAPGSIAVQATTITTDVAVPWATPQGHGIAELHATAQAAGTAVELPHSQEHGTASASASDSDAEMDSSAIWATGNAAFSRADSHAGGAGDAHDAQSPTPRNDHAAAQHEGAAPGPAPHTVHVLVLPDGPHVQVAAAAANAAARLMNFFIDVHASIARFMTAVADQCTLAMKQLNHWQPYILGAIALLWYSFGMSLVKSSLAKLSTFSPVQPPGVALVAFTCATAKMMSDTVLERVSFFFQGWSSSSVLVKIPMVLLSAVPIIITFGTAYKGVTGCTWGQAFLKIHSVINRQPGANMVNEKSLPAFLLVNGAFFSGLFTFAVFLGLVSDEVKRSFRSIKNGTYPLRHQGHVLILNWNRDAIPLLRQLCLGRKYTEEPFFDRPIVVLAAKDKNDIDEEIFDRLKYSNVEVYTRSGNPSFPRDLDMVAARNADTVVVLHPEASLPKSAEAAKAATAMALTVIGNQRAQNVVFQMPKEVASEVDFVHSFSRSCTGGLNANVQVLKMPDVNFMNRFTCHAAVQPGMFRVWQKILQQGPSNVKLRVKPLPAMFEGRSFVEVRRSYRDCVVVGFTRGADNVVFDPEESQTLALGDKLIMLSYVVDPKPQISAQTVFSEACKSATERLARSSNYNVAPKKVIVAGWDPSRLQDMIECFADASPENSTITFIMPHIPEDPGPPGRWGVCRFNYVQSDHPTSHKALMDAGLKTADALVLTGLLEGLSHMEADAMVLAGLLQVQDAVSASGRTTAPHVVAKVHRTATMMVIQQYFEMLNSQSCKRKEAADVGKVLAVLALKPAAAPAAPSTSASAKPSASDEAGSSSGAVTASAATSTSASGHSSSSTNSGGCSSSSSSSSQPAGSSSSSNASSDSFAQAPGSGTASSSSGPSSSTPAPTASSSTSPATSSSAAAANKKVPPAPPAPVLIKNPEIFLPDDISAALLAQVAAHPDVTALIRRLLTTREGVELYLRNPAAFNITAGETVTFAEVAEAARRLRQTAIGYLKADGAIIMVPEPEALHTFKEGDQVIVFAEDYKIRRR